MDQDYYQFDTSLYRNSRIASLRGECDWTDAQVARKSPEERAAWQNDFRQRFAQVLGGLETWERPPLEPEVVESRQMDGYRREAVTFTARPGLLAFGWFLIPDNVLAGRPAILCLPGHGVGADGVVGIAEEEYSADFALQCVRQGYPTFALELIGFGHRRDAAARSQGPRASSCVRDSMAALMVGETMPGWRAWDAMRALDYLQTRTEVVDPSLLAVMGISGGGLAALFTAALDTRVTAAVVSGYLNTFAASILTIDHCVDNYAPGLQCLCEMPDLTALVAPRALFVESGRDDPIFPLAAFKQATTKARDIYEVFGAPERFGSEIFEGDHHFHGVGAFTFLKTALPVSE